MNKASILAGFTEYTPKEQGVFNAITETFIDVYRRNGCLNIDTPILEKADVLLAKSGGDTEKQVYRFEKGKNDIVMRYDLTVPLARYVTMNRNDIAFPFKRYQLGKVYRGERNQRGRYREFYQLDLDCINVGSLAIENDAWSISLVSQAFKAIGLSGYTFNISNRKLLKGFLESLRIEDVLDVTRLIDRIDKMTKEDFREELIKLVGQERAQEVEAFILMKGKSEEMLQTLSEVDSSNDIFLEGLKELECLIDTLRKLGLDEEEYVINLKIIRGLDYYTGTVFETFLEGNENFCSICSGGRYDNLLSLYSDEVMPGVGISIGLTRLFYVLKEIGFIDDYISVAAKSYLIIPLGDTLSECIAIRQQLMDDGKAVDIYFETGSMKKKMRYANRMEVDYVLVIGEDEVKNRKVTMKNMKGDEDSILRW